MSNRARPSSSPPGGAIRRPPPVLVGRERERRLLAEELAAIRLGRGRFVLLGGEAGIGKTTLARALARDAEALGVCFLSGHCFDLTNAPPYGPWLEVFRKGGADPAWANAPAAFRDGLLGPVPDQAALFADVRRFFAALATRQPVYLLLEDLHWADAATLQLLRQVASAIEEWPLLLVATYRDDELRRGHPLALALPALVRESDALRIELKRFDGEALGELVTRRYRLPPVDVARLVAYLERHADGNPFFAVELLRALEDEGFLRAGADRSALGELARVVVPALLRHVIDGRVTRIGEALRRPLELAAVIGQEVPLGLWAELAELDDDAMLSIVERLIEAHVIEAMRDGTRVRFVHALTREAIHEGILPPRRRLWHLRVGEALARDPGADPDTVALHFEQAGDARAVEWLQRAGDRAQRSYAWLTAADRLRSAADLLRDRPGHERQRGMLMFRVGYLLRFSDTARSIEALDEAERLAERIGDARLAADIQYARGLHTCYTDRFRAGTDEMHRALVALEAMELDTSRVRAAIYPWFAPAIPDLAGVDLSEDERLLARLHREGFDYRRWVHVWHRAAAGAAGDDLARGRRFLTLIGELSGARGGVRFASAFAHFSDLIAHAAAGLPEQARAAGERCRALFAEVDHHVIIAFSLLAELRDVTLTYGAADPSARRRLAAEAEAALARAGGALRPGVSPRLALLGCLLLDGRWAEADRILRGLPDPGNSYLRREVTAAITFLALQRGDAERAWREIWSLLPAGPATEPGDIIHQEGLELQRLAVELHVAAGELARARAWLEAHDRWLAWSGSLLGQAAGKLAWARWQQAVGDAPRARACALEALALAAAPGQPLVTLAAHRLLGELATAAGDAKQAAGHLEPALALAAACEAPFERALTLVALAGLRAATGDLEGEARLLDEAGEIATERGATTLSDRVERHRAAAPEPAPQAGLTARELDVLRLVTAGRTNAEIADALYITRRTVTSHVEHVFAKLDVHTRAEAGAVARERGIA